MADEPIAVETSEEDDEFEQWLAEVDEDEDMQEAAEGQYKNEDDKALKTAQETKQMFVKHVKEERVEKKVETFMEAASDTEKELFAIFRKGDENEKQLDALIELVKAKATTADTRFVSPEEIEERAAEKAAAAVGPGPLRQGERVKTDPEAEALERVKSGDSHATATIFFKDDPILGRFFGER